MSLGLKKTGNWTGRTLYQVLPCLAIILFVLILPWQASAAMAAGFHGPGVAETINWAADVATAMDDAPCVLEGHILEKIPHRKHRYLFADQSGQVIVEIEHQAFGDNTVTPETKVRLVGHVDWSKKHPNEVEVDYLTIINDTGAADKRQ